MGQPELGNMPPPIPLRISKVAGDFEAKFTDDLPSLGDEITITLTLTVASIVQKRNRDGELVRTIGYSADFDR